MKLSFSVVALLCGFSLVAAAVDTTVATRASEPPKSVRIIYSNDMMGYVEPCG